MEVEVVAVDLPCSLAREDLPTYVGQLGLLGLALRSMLEAHAAMLREALLSGGALGGPHHAFGPHAKICCPNSASQGTVRDRSKS